MRVAGLDGCRGGWFVTRAGPGLAGFECFVAPDFPAAMALLADCSVIGVDIPIGLPARGSRACDQEARRLLAPRRSASVFPAPIRPVLGARSYREACDRREAVDGKRMSVQAYHLLEKISEVDSVLRADEAIRTRVREVHPELAFASLAAGSPACYPKRDPRGVRERSALLAPLIGPERLDAALAASPRSRAGRDDVLDALAVLLAAGRIAAGRGRCVPAHRPADEVGLEMAIWY